MKTFSCLKFLEESDSEEEEKPAAKPQQKQSQVKPVPESKKSAGMDRDLFGSPESDEDDIFAQVTKTKKTEGKFLQLLGHSKTWRYFGRFSCNCLQTLQISI